MSEPQAHASDDLLRFFYLDNEPQWLIRGPHHASRNNRTEHVEVIRHGPTHEHGAYYSKRFLPVEGHLQLEYWTQRELKFLGHFGPNRTPYVVKPRMLEFHDEGVARVETMDAGHTLLDWQKLLVSRAPSGGELTLPLTSPVNLARTLLACLRALREIHGKGIVHCDIKADNICLPHSGQPLADSGFRLNFPQLRLIDFAFAVWPSAPDWELHQPLPIDPDSANADYLSPRFRQILRDDSGPQFVHAWRHIDYGVDLYALGVLFTKLLRQHKDDRNPDDGHADLIPVLTSIADELVAGYAEHAASADTSNLPHLDFIARIEAGLADTAEPDRLFAKQLRSIPREPATPLAAANQSGGITPIAAAVASPHRPKPTPQRHRRKSLWRKTGLLGVPVATLAAAYLLLPRIQALTQASDPVRPAPMVETCPDQPPSLPMVGEPLQLGGEVLTIAVDATRQRAAAGVSNGELVLWTPGREQSPIRSQGLQRRPAIRSLAFSPDGRMLASGDAGQIVQRWDSASGEPIGGPLKGQDDIVIALGFSADGAELTSASSSGQLLHWNARTGQPLRRPDKGFAVTALSFSRDLRLLATGTESGEVGIFVNATQQSIGEPQAGHTQFVTSLAFSHDASKLVSASFDKTLQRWSVYTGKPLTESPLTHPQPVTSVAFVEDDRRFATADVDGAIRLWDYQSGCLMATAEHDGGVTALAATGQGADWVLLTGGHDGSVRRWRLPDAGQH